MLPIKTLDYSVFESSFYISFSLCQESWFFKDTSDYRIRKSHNYSFIFIPYYTCSSLRMTTVILLKTLKSILLLILSPSLQHLGLAVSSETLFVQQNEMFAQQHFRAPSLSQTPCYKGGRDTTLFSKSWIVGLRGVIPVQEGMAPKSGFFFFFKGTVNDVIAYFLK